jgi:hypothetical protein
VLAGAALLLTGCQLDLELAVEVNRNGGGVLSVALEADGALRDRAAEADVDPLADLARSGRALAPDGWRVAERDTPGGGRRVTLRREFADPAEFAIVAQQLADALAAEEVVLLDALQLTLTDDRVRVEGAAGAEPTRAVRDYGVGPRRAVALLREEEAFEYHVTVDLPGEVLSGTAGGQEGSTLTWTIAPGERVTIAAESTRPGPPILRAVLGALGGGLLAGALLLGWSRRRRPRPSRLTGDVTAR